MPIRPANAALAAERSLMNSRRLMYPSHEAHPGLATDSWMDTLPPHTDPFDLSRIPFVQAVCWPSSLLGSCSERTTYHGPTSDGT